MSKLLIFIMFVASDIKHYKDKIYYIEPTIAERIAKEQVLLFKTKIKAKKAYLVKNGNIITYDNATICMYSKEGKLINTYKIAFYPDLIVPSEDGSFVILGQKDKDKKIYELFKLNMANGEQNHFLTISTEKFPGISTPIKRVKEIMKTDESYAKDFYWLVVNSINFAAGKIIGDNLYLWYYPEVGMIFGGVYKISLKTKRLDIIIKDLDIFCGITNDSIFYIPFKDEDATEMANALYLFEEGKTHKSPFPYITSNTIVANGTGATLKDNTLYMFSFSSIDPMYKQTINGKDVRLLNISQSGNRTFLSYNTSEKSIVSVFDIRTGKNEEIFEVRKGGFENLQSTFDGESFIFTAKDTLFLGYLNDLYAPFIITSMPDTSYDNAIKVKVSSYDVAFVSNGVELELNGKKIPSDTTLVLTLSEGDNFFAFKAKDRAFNVREKSKHVFYIPKRK